MSRIITRRVLGRRLMTVILMERAGPKRRAAIGRAEAIPQGRWE